MPSSSSPSSPFISILPATRADLPALTSLFHAAFADDPYLTIIHGACDPAAVKAQTLRGFEEGFERNGAVWFKAVTRRGKKELEREDEDEEDEEGGERILGFSKWEYPHPTTTADPTPPPPPLPGSLPGLSRAFHAGLARAREKYLDPARDFYMALLVVDPGFQRRGIGGMLLAPGLARADETWARAYVQASEMGRGVYERCGWAGVGVVEMEYGEEGGGRVGRTMVMIREPRRGGE